MKKIYIAFLCFATTICALAADRSVNQLKSIAYEKLVKSAVSHSKGSNTHPIDVVDEVQVISNDGGIAILGMRNHGFVVLATDDDCAPILGYTDADYDVTMSNPNLAWWLESVKKSMSARRFRAMPVPDGFPVEVAPFVKTQWNQGTPYNNLTPSYVSGGSTKHYPTGCVATAMAQTMYHYCWPMVGQGRKTYKFNPQDGTGPQIVSLDLSQMPFNWEKMVPVYTSGNTEEECLAVATLMAACGASVEMEYTASGSGAMISDACVALRKNFDYDKNLPYYFCSFISNGETMAVACKHLAENHPLLVGGYNPSSGGHAFVLDGYDRDGLMHVNWGWGPRGGNGYFNLFVLDGYSEQIQIVPVYKESETGYASIWTLAPDGEVVMGKRDDTHISFGTTDRPLNIDATSYKGSLYVVATRYDDPEVTKPLATQTLLSETTMPLYYGMTSVMNKGNITISNKGITDGSYRVYLASKGEGETAYRPVRTADDKTNSYTMVVQNGRITSVTPNSDNDWMKPKPATPSFVRGDANDDGTVTVTDIVATANHILGATPETFNSEAADSNQDNEITVTDIVYDAQYILNGKFPE